MPWLGTKADGCVDGGGVGLWRCCTGAFGAGGAAGALVVGGTASVLLSLGRLFCWANCCSMPRWEGSKPVVCRASSRLSVGSAEW